MLVQIETVRSPSAETANPDRIDNVHHDQCDTELKQ